MADLGSSTDPDALVPGSVGSVRGNASSLRERSTQLDSAADKLAQVRVAGWDGASADAFWQLMNAQPRSWRTTADALTAAAVKLETYADVLAGAKRDAGEAIELWAAGEAATAVNDRQFAADRAAYERSVRAQVLLPLPRKHPDPGADPRRQAVDLLDDARDAVRRAGDDAADVLGEIVVSDSPIIHNEAGWAGPGVTGSTSGPVFHIDPETGKLTLDLGKAEGEASLFSADASTEAKYGTLFAAAQAGVLIGAKGEAVFGVGEGNFRAKAEGSAGVIADASARAGFEHGSVGATASGLAGAYAEAGVTIGKDGVEADVGAFAGAKGGLGLDVDLAGVGVGANAEGWAGVGAEADIGLEQDEHGRWTFDMKAGAAVGLGGSLSTSITVDPRAVMDAADDAADFFRDSFG